MRITDLQAFLMSCPLPEPMVMPFHGGVRTILKRDALLIKVSTDGGLVGYGSGPASARAAELISGPIREQVRGQDPSTPSELRDRALAGSSEELVLAYSGVEIALYDLLGKMEGCPVHELLGGRARDRIRLYGSAGMYQSPSAYAEEAAAVAALGFKAYKMRPASSPEEDLVTVRLMREAVGPEVGIMVDAHAWWRMGDLSYSPQQIAELAAAMGEYGIAWLEEPLPPEDRQAYVNLRQAVSVPLAAGEHETSLDGFLDLVNQEAVDIVQADVSHHGGYATVGPVIEASANRGQSFAFHNWGTLLEALASAHLGICFTEKQCAWLEYPCYRHRGQNIMYPYPLADEILREPLHIENGDLLIPDGPGLGIEVDESVIERYPYVPGPWSIFRQTSPPIEVLLSGDHVDRGTEA